MIYLRPVKVRNGDAFLLYFKKSLNRHEDRVYCLLDFDNRVLMSTTDCLVSVGIETRKGLFKDLSRSFKPLKNTPTSY